MAAQLVLLVPLGETGLVPGHDLPGGGYGGRPDNSLPGGGRDSIWGRPGIDHPGNRPIYHPGHPDHGMPVPPSGTLPVYHPSHPDNSLPVPPGVGTAPVPPDLAEKVVVLWHMPGQVEWHGKVIDPSLEAGMPLPPAPAPKY